MATVTLDGVRKSFADREVVHGVSCEVADGELVVVVGPSGRGIVRDPKVFLFDEPLSNLDAQLRVQMRVEIKRLQQELATTSLYVTHDQVEAMTLADRLIVMNAGNVDQIGRPLDLYERPATAFVAGFIGSPAMNLLAGRLDADRVVVGESRFALSGRSRPPGPVTVGLRPEHLDIAADGPIGLRIEL